MYVIIYVIMYACTYVCNYGSNYAGMCGKKQIRPEAENRAESDAGKTPWLSRTQLMEEAQRAGKRGGKSGQSGQETRWNSMMR